MFAFCRAIGIGAGVALGMLAAAGCSNGPGARFYPKPEPAAPHLTSTAPSSAELVAHLNQQAQTVKALEAQDLSIKASQGGLNEYSLKGMLLYQKPRNFRLVAEALRKTEADFGSNDNEFWFFINRSEPRALYHCSYSDYGKGSASPLSVQPEWVADALCVQELNPHDQYQLRPLGNQAIELISPMPSPQGQLIYKVIVVATRGPNAGRILMQKLVQKVGQGKGRDDWQELWVAEIHEYQSVQGFVVPYRMTLRSGIDKTTLKLTLDGCQVNPPSLMTNQTMNSFVRPTVGAPEIDLARYNVPSQGTSHSRGSR